MTINSAEHRIWVNAMHLVHSEEHVIMGDGCKMAQEDSIGRDIFSIVTASKGDMKD
jgi:hypothetical protein